MTFKDSLNNRLQNLQQQTLYRSRRVVDLAQDTMVTINDKSLINFCSNDYLGLANHPEVKHAFKEAVDYYGVGSGASQLVTGHQKPHHLLEDELAEFFGRERVLLFSTGYMANLGVVSALAGREDVVFEDRLNHASLIDAALLSRAKFSRYAHHDINALETQLKKSNAKNKFVISDGVFSMDGDKANLEQLISLSQQQNAVLMIDDAHGIGILGKIGRGIIDELPNSISSAELPILVGTFGKAFGTFGAFVAGSHELIESLINFARSYIYTTAMPAAVAEATRVSLNIIKQGDALRERLQKNIQYFREGCVDHGLPVETAPSYGEHSAIQPIVVGSAEKAVQLSAMLQADGLLVSAIRPPTVPQDTSRLRITFSATHSEEQIDVLLTALSSHYAKC